MPIGKATETSSPQATNKTTVVQPPLTDQAVQQSPSPPVYVPQGNQTPQPQPSSIHAGNYAPISPVVPVQQSFQQYNAPQYASNLGTGTLPMHTAGYTNPNPNQATTAASIVNPPYTQRHCTQPSGQTPVQAPQQVYMGGDIKQPLATVHEVPSQGDPKVQQQPQSGTPMQYAQPSAEDEKKQRRAEQIAKARHITGETCIICGKGCVILGSVMAAACSLMCCLMSCAGGIGSGGAGMGGGGGLGLSISAPSDY